ncbi:DMT family transporter [Sphingomonas sp.]|uniref:DMT family transporter n=1 Tax=Sphingomonas sp. TaxID=28214 RepID=UPI002DD63CF8|nr:DMT family transporter [Sphingomonas sp.]
MTSAVPRPGQAKALPLAALFASNMALAFGPWFVRLADVGPVAAGFWRIALATPVLLAAAMLLGQNPVRQARGLWGVLALGGLAFAADLAAWHAGIHHTLLANATLFGNAATLIFPIYAFIVARSWPSRTQGLALGMAAAGAALLMGRSAQLSSQNLIGDLLCLTAGVLYAVYFVTMARARETMQPLPALALSSLLGTAPLLLAAILLGERVWPGNWTPLLGLAIVSQLVGQGLMIYALGHLTPLVVGIALLTQPIVAGAIGWFAYHERLGLPDLLGAALVGLALVLVRRGNAPQQLEPAGAEGHKER